MPLTFPAHQGLVAAAKLRWPRWVDGTALCIGAAAPDLAYPLGSWMAHHSHSSIGLLVWALPFTLLASELTRRWSAAGIFAHLPDCGPLRLRSYRVLAQRRPLRVVTFLSAVVGATSHVLVDSFSHTGRWGADLLGLDVVLFTLPYPGPVSAADLVQVLGHFLGALAFLIVLIEIAGSGRLEAWYGDDAVETARAVIPTTSERVGFWTPVIGSTVAAFVGAAVLGGTVLFWPITALTIALLVAGAIVPALYR